MSIHKSICIIFMKIQILSKNTFYGEIMKIKNFMNQLFAYKEQEDYEFILPNSANNLPESEVETEKQKIYPTLSVNIEYLKTKYNLLINSDVKIRKFAIPIQDKKVAAALLYIDGMVDETTITNSVLQPLLLKNSITMQEQQNNNKPGRISIKNMRQPKINLENFIYNGLIPHNSISKESEFEEVIPKVNAGFCALFVDTIGTAFCVETKGFKGRTVSEPITESIIRGSQEAFVENIRINTSLLRKIVNNENFVIEEVDVGKVSKTKVAICYIQNIANDDLVAETKFRINNLNIDYLLSSGQLEQFIKDNPNNTFPQTIATERPDRVSSYLLHGRVAIVVNGTPFVLVVPAVFIDFLSSAEDKNLNYHFANFLKFIRAIALFFAIFLPGLYVAITNYHQELIPSELLFAIANAREAIPFPVIFEILIMEISFELIREAGLRVSSSFSTTIGIIGALILGDAAVSASIVSPILIIVVAFTGICSFAIPDFALTTSIRIYRFFYIALGFLAGFLGIAFGFFIHFILLTNLSSFGVPYFAPYIPFENLNQNNGYIMKPVWKREKRSQYLNTKRPEVADKISMEWRKNVK